MNEIILDIRTVDFGNADAVWNFANRTIQAANVAGMFMTKGPLNKEQRGIRIIAKDWVNRVETAIDSMSAGNALRVIYMFDLINRIAYGTPANADYLDKYRLGAFEAYIRGDKSVDCYELFHALMEEICKRNRTYFGRPLEWVAMCLDRWHKNFINGVSTATQSDYDTMQQLTALLCSDLRVFERDQDAFKRRLVANHLDYLTGNASRTDTKMQKALHLLRFHASKYLPSKKHTA